MSNNKRVADALEACNWSGDSIGNKAIIAQAIVCLRAEQNQGEPVALPERKITNGLNWNASLVAESWNACIDELAKLGPLYTHGDPAEVERLRAQVNDWTGKWEKAIKAGAALESKLAERDALLRGAAHLADRLHKSSLGMRRQALAELLSFLSDASASAEPSAPPDRSSLSPERKP